MAMREALELKQLRLEEDLSYKALANQIGISRGKLHALLTDTNATAGERVLFKVRRYLNRMRQPGAAA